MSKKTASSGRQDVVRTKDGWVVRQRNDEGAFRSVKKDYGKGLPPPGPSNYLVTTPNFLPFGSDDDSKKGQ
ncbi:MAG: hypothetical protein QOJ59_4749 [Thermomicrobiales bacterium]|nr:hypothetical protein [Thermomicrobiales bacterium]